MGLFVNTSSLHNHYQDCCTIDVGETIERDCLSVLHKLHDQVNGLQLVQVVVQPLARLFNPASLAALANVTSPPSSVNNNSTNVPNATSTQPNVTTPTSQHPAAGGHLHQDPDMLSTNTGLSSSNLNSTNHSRSQSFVSAAFNNSSNQGTNSLLSASSTYMMSPDTAQALISRLDTDRDVNWLMEIIGYGLSMPFSLTGEQDSVKDCCTIYCEWLASALLPYNEQNEDSKYQQLSKLVPVPIRSDPNRYARKMLSHLYNVFLPRQISLAIAGPTSNQKDQTDAALTAVSRQAVLCHRVLRTIENIAQNPNNLMDNQTWDHLLALLLTVNDKLLSAPTEPDDIGTQLHDRILGVLFELMLLASAKSIPSISLWKTFHEMCLNWRHRPALIDHWRRITLLLTKRIVQTPVHMRVSRKDSTETDIYNQETQFNKSASLTTPCELAIASMNYDNLSQTWYRFLTLIGNPVELSEPNVISRTDEFYHSACASDNVLDPRQHPCLNVLPQIFVNSMSGLRDFIEAFLGSYQQTSVEDQPSIDLERSPYSVSARGSIASLTTNNNNLTLSSFSTSQSSATATNLQAHQTQPQAITPTQSRRTGIISKGIKGAKVIPFSPPSAGSQSNVLNSPSDFNQELAKQVSNSSRQQLNQPKLSLTSISSRTSQVSQLQPQQFKLSTDRPKCNSLLHVFGDWLFGAALIGSELNQEVDETNDGNTSEEATSVGSSSTTTEISGPRSYSPTSYRKKLSKGAIFKNISQNQSTKDSTKNSASHTTEKIMLDPPLTAESFEFGQAEAMAILCKIFSSKTTTEDISPTYLSRFYLCLQHCLTFGSGQDVRQPGQPAVYSVIRRQLLASVLVNSTTLLQKDLDGINLLIPSFIKAIEFVFECSDKDVPIQPPPRQHDRSLRGSNSTASNKPVTNYDLRRACILTLLNLLAYPFHFQDLAIRNCLNGSSPITTFKSLRPRLLKLLFVAMQTESDATNMQILFGGLSLTIHDLSINSNKLSSGPKNDSLRSRHKSESTSSSITGNESFNSSLEASKQDDSASQSSFVFNSNGGFLVKSLHVTCHLLINIWKHDTQVSLAALELLTTIARISTSSYLIENLDSSNSKSANQKVTNNNNRIEMRNEYKQTTKWICDYICNQCSRPPPAHSRDMHSTIVAAYQCLSVWFYNHPYLLNDQHCVATLMEVIELGVSGQKSKLTVINPTTGVPNQSTTSKKDKIMKPSSMRVREAAESLLNICMVRARFSNDEQQRAISCYDTVLDEQALAEIFGGIQYKTSIRQIQDSEQRQVEAYKLFKYFSDEDSVVFGFLEGLNHDPTTKDSIICLIRTPFGKHCWKMKFNYYTEKSREKIIANKTIGLIKRPFQSTTPNSETRLFPFPSGQNKSLYFNNSARFFPEAIENLPVNSLDKLVTSLDDYVSNQNKDSKLHNDLDKMKKIFSHQMVAEQKVISECSIRIKRVECEEPQPMSELEAARIVVTHLGLKSSLNSLIKGEKVSPTFVTDLKSLDCQSVRTCDSVGIFYIRRNRTSPKEILESVRARHNVSLAFFEWLLELGQPVVVKNHCRWTGKVSNSWNTRAILHNSLTISNSETAESQATFSRNQMLASDHGGAIFDGERMTLYWSDMCQELAFLIPHKIERATLNLSQDFQPGAKVSTPMSDCDLGIGSTNQNSQSFELNLDAHNRSRSIQDSISSQLSSSQDHNSDRQSLCSVTSDTSSHSTRAPSQQSSPRDHHQSARDQKDNASLSKQSITAQKKKSTNNSCIVGCDTNIIICWLECSDDLAEVPHDTLLSISETGFLVEDGSKSSELTGSNLAQPRLRARDYVKYFISPMKNGLYRVNLITSFGRHWLALPLVDGMTVSKGILSSLIRESILNLCRRRRLDADSYQPPHVKRRLKIQELCNSYKISSRYESAEFYNNLFKTSKAS